MNPKDDITLKTILEHIRAMEGRLISRIEGIEIGLKGVETGLKELRTDFGRLEVKVDLISTQVANIDARLDDLEVVQVPKLKKAVGMS